MILNKDFTDETFYPAAICSFIVNFSLNACKERNNMSVQEQTEARFKIEPRARNNHTGSRLRLIMHGADETYK